MADFGMNAIDLAAHPDFGRDPYTTRNRVVDGRLIRGGAYILGIDVGGKSGRVAMVIARKGRDGGLVIEDIQEFSQQELAERKGENVEGLLD